MEHPLLEVIQELITNSIRAYGVVTQFDMESDENRPDLPPQLIVIKVMFQWI